MVGYVYLDLDRNLVYKTAEYIQSDNPYFFSQNSHLIVKKWRFDTNESSIMENMFRNFADLALTPNTVKLFADSIGFLPKAQRQDANKV
jgi:hypothetical protein